MRTADKSLIKIYLFLFFVVAMLWLFGCNPVKRVLSDPKKKEIVGREWEKENPCLPSTVIPGKDSIRVDTVFNDVPFGSDSTRVDTLESTITKTVIKKVPVYITKTSYRVDTVQDLRRINQLNKDIANRDGQIVQLTANYKQERKRANTYLWILIGGFALYVGTRFIKVKPKWL